MRISSAEVETPASAGPDTVRGTALSVEPPKHDSDQGAAHAALRVLLVEDNETDRWFFTEVLRSRGHTVVACASGEEALEAVDRELPELVMLDIGLPGIPGLEVCRAIRTRPDGHLPLVMVVTSTEEGDTLDEALAVGADDFLKKPVEPPSLLTRLQIAERRILVDRSLRRAESALLSKTREIEALFNNIQDVFFSLDLTRGQLIQTSPATVGLFGLTPEEVAADEDTWSRLLIPEGAPWTPGAAPAPDGSFVLEYSIEAADGKLKWIRARVQIETDPESGEARADGLLVDITEEHVARQELAERNQELETLHRLADLSLSAESLGEAYDQMLALVSDAMGFPIAAIEHLDRETDRLVLTATKGIPGAEGGTLEIPLHRTPSGKAIQTGRPVLELDPMDDNGLSDDVLADLGLNSFAAFPLMGGGTPIGTLMLAHTERVPMDERFERLGQSLATTLTTYVERLEAEEAIRQSEARYRGLASQLQQANEELESFAYSVSHDLRSPLRTMQGFAHALMQNYGDVLPEEARDFARRIIASGEQAEQLISDPLAYSRLSFERLELQPVELANVVAQAREQVQHDLTHSKAHLTLEEPLPVVRGNLTALVQAVANLLSNAVKFVPPDRKPEIRIRAESRDGLVRLWVEDNGVGVPEGQEERVFRVFERLAETGDRPGTGIGLAVVRRAHQRIGGDCGVERLPDRGSAFWIEMPAERRSGRRLGRRPR